MSRTYARKSILARVDRTITDDSPKDIDGKLLQEACILTDYYSVEFKYIKARIENKYGFQFKYYYKRQHVVEEWEKEKNTLFAIQKPDTKKSATSKKSAKPRVITENNWTNSCKDELSPSQALERFYKLKEKEKKQRLLEEVRNVELLW